MTMELSRQYRQMLYRMSLYQTAKEQQLSVGTLPVLSQYHLTGGFRLFQKEHPEISLAPVSYTHLIVLKDLCTRTTTFRVLL